MLAECTKYIGKHVEIKAKLRDKLFGVLVPN